MATIDELVIELTAETKGLQSELKIAASAMKDATEQMQKSVAEFSKESSKDTDFFQEAFATMAGFISGEIVLGAFNAVKDAVLDLAHAMITEGVKGASEQQDAMQALAEQLARTGRLTGTAVADFNNFASALQTSSKFTDDQAISAAHLLANLTNLNEQGLEKATQGAADLAAAMGISLEQAAGLVGKAINGQMTALQRFGITVQEGSTKAENFANVMKVINERFSGAALSQTKTFSGGIDQVKKSWGEATEAVGNAIVENKVVIAVINQVGQILNQFQAFLAGNTDTMKKFIAEGILKAIDALGFLASVMNEVQKVFNESVAIIKAPFEALATGIAAAQAAASGQFAVAKDILVSGAKDIHDEFQASFKDSDTFNVFTDKLAEVRGAAQRAFDTMKDGANAVIPPTNNAAAALNQLTDAQEAALKKSTEYALSLSEQAATSEGVYALELSNLESTREAQLQVDEGYFTNIQEMQANNLEINAAYLAEKEAMVNQNLLNEQAMLDAAIANGRISSTQAAQAQLALEAKKTNDLNALQVARTKFEADNNKQRQQNFSDTLNTISSLASSNNKTLAGIGKAAAISQATIDGFVAVQKALASAPPPFNFALAAAVGAATVANVAKISGTPLATGIDQVPGIGSNDNFPAVLAPGERVVPAKTNEDLSAFLKEESASPKTQITVNVTMNDVFTSDPREMGLKIINVINEAAQANGVTLLGSKIG